MPGFGKAKGKAKGHEDNEGGQGKVILVRKEGSNATVTVFPVGEDVNGTAYLTKVDHAVKDLVADIISGDDPLYAKMVAKHYVSPVVRKAINSATPGQSVTVSLSRSDYGLGKNVDQDDTGDETAEDEANVA